MFNCYKYWTQILLLQPEEPPVTLLIPEGITLGDTLSVVLYWITLVPLAEDLLSEDPGLLFQFYADSAVFDGSVRRSAQILKLLMERGAYQGYFTNPDKSLFIAGFLEQEELANTEFVAEGLDLNFI